MLELAELIAATRPGYDLSKLAEWLPSATDRVHRLEIPMLAISSTEIRMRVARGAPIQYLVPEGVASYVDKRGLYRPAPDGLELPAGTGP